MRDSNNRLISSFCRGGFEKETVPPGGIRMWEITGGGDDRRQCLIRRNGEGAGGGGYCRSRQRRPTPEEQNAHDPRRCDGTMGMVGGRDSGTIEMVAAGGDAAEMQDKEGQQREAEILG